MTQKQYAKYVNYPIRYGSNGITTIRVQPRRNNGLKIVLMALVPSIAIIVAALTYVPK